MKRLILSTNSNSIIKFYHKVLNDKLVGGFLLYLLEIILDRLSFIIFCVSKFVKLVGKQFLPHVSPILMCLQWVVKNAKLEQWDGIIIHSRHRTKVKMFIKMIKSFSRVICHDLSILLINFIKKQNILQRQFLIDTFVLPKMNTLPYYSGISDFLSKKKYPKLDLFQHLWIQIELLLQYS